MSKFKAFPEIFIEETEINRMTELISVLGFNKIFSSLTKTYGIIKKDLADTSLQVYESSTGKIGLRSGYALNSSGEFISNNSDTPDVLTIPDDGVTRKIFITYYQTQIETGTISISSGGAVVGVGTEFNKIFKAGKKLEIINSLLGNDGAYEISSVTDDLNLQLTGSFTAETNLQFKMQGKFTPGVVVPDGNKRPYYYDSFSVTLESDANLPTDDKFLLARIARVGSTLTITDSRDSNIHKFKESYLGEFSQSFTNAVEFKVGGIDGTPVLLQQDAAPDIINLRIVDISTVSQPELIDPSANQTSELRRDYKLEVKLSFGYNALEGVGSTLGSFTISNLGFSPTVNQFVGYFIYISTNDTNYKITANNTSGNFTLANLDGTVPNLTGIASNSVNPATINFNAEKYEIIAIPYYSETYHEENLIAKEFNADNFLKNMIVALSLNSGIKYLIKMRAIVGALKTNYLEMSSGSFTKYGIAQNYDKPALITHPTIDSTGVVIGLTASDTGFNIEVTGWDSADQFEAKWTTSEAGVDYTKTDQPSAIFTSKKFEVTTNVSAKYYVKVRPVIGGNQVAIPQPTDKGGEVLSGAGGIKPEDRLIASAEISLETYSGSINVLSTGATFRGVISTTNLKSPADSTDPEDAILSVGNLLGSVMLVGGDEYRIYKQDDLIVFGRPLYHDNSISTGVKTFLINTTKNGRRIKDVKLDVDTRLNSYTFDNNILDLAGGAAAIVRIYQPTNESQTDYIDVPNADEIYIKSGDVIIASSNGERILRIDVYDPQGNSNKTNIGGSLSVIGVPVTNN